MHDAVVLGVVRFRTLRWTTNAIPSIGCRAARPATRLEPGAAPSASASLCSKDIREYCRLVARRATYDHKKRRTRPVLFSAVVSRNYWKRRIFTWWAHQGSNLGPAD